MPWMEHNLSNVEYRGGSLGKGFLLATMSTTYFVTLENRTMLRACEKNCRQNLHVQRPKGGERCVMGSEKLAPGTPNMMVKNHGKFKLWCCKILQNKPMT